MKKFLTLIAFIGALVPAVHGMEANLFSDVQKKYDHLVTLIKNADVDAFKLAFDEAKLPSTDSLMVLHHAAKIESIKAVAVLEQVVLETKAAVAKELEALGDSNKNWSKIVKGALATFSAGWTGVSSLIVTAECINIKNDRASFRFEKSLGGKLLMLPCAMLGTVIKKYIKGSNVAYDH